MVYDGDDYAIYVSFYQHKRSDDHDEFEYAEYALAAVDSSKPVFVICHYPLHYISTRTTTNASDFIDVLMITECHILLGHNHSQATPHMEH